MTLLQDYVKQVQINETFDWKIRGPSLVTVQSKLYLSMTEKTT